MKPEVMIPVDDLCTHYQVEQTFIQSLSEAGLVEIASIEKTICIPVSQLPFFEKMIRLYELDINLEGIETITHLLNRINEQQEKIITLTNQLRRYETDETFNSASL
jgi:chaperone modulatory protein CbpM